MALMRQLVSPRNAEIRELLKLRDRRTRDREGLFLIEGRREVTRAVQADVRIRTLYLCDEFGGPAGMTDLIDNLQLLGVEDRKSTRLNSSHVAISYAVFCLKKKKII